MKVTELSEIAGGCEILLLEALWSSAIFGGLRV